MDETSRDGKSLFTYSHRFPASHCHSRYVRIHRTVNKKGYPRLNTFSLVSFNCSTFLGGNLGKRNEHKKVVLCTRGLIY